MLTPIGDLVFVQKVAEEATGLLIIPTADEPRGTIVAVGPGKTYSDGAIIPLSVRIGDEVIYSKHAGQTFSVDGTDLIALREDDIYAVIGELDATVTE